MRTVQLSHSIQFYLNSAFNNRHCHRAAFRNPEVDLHPLCASEGEGDKEQLPKTTSGRNLERNQTCKRTHRFLGDVRQWNYKSMKYTAGERKANSTKRVEMMFTISKRE